MHTVTQSPIAAQSIDRAACLARLNLGLLVRTSNGIAGKGCDPTFSRPFYVSPIANGITTWHESAALAIARLATL